MTEGIIRERGALVYKGGRFQRATVEVIQEVPFTLYVNDQELVTLLCSGHHLEELAVGFLAAEGIVRTLSDVLSVRIDERQGTAYMELGEDSLVSRDLFMKRTLGSGCGRASVYFQPLDALSIYPIEGGPMVTPESVTELMREVNRSSPLYRSTRCTHHAALAAHQKIRVHREDIGRHNAVDMAVGWAMRAGMDFRDMMLLTTGRATSEMVLKAARVGIPVVVSRSAPTHLGVEVAEQAGITLVGSARAGGMRVFTHPQRIAL